MEQPEWLDRQGVDNRPYPMYGDDFADMVLLINACVAEIQSLNARIAVLEAGQRELSTRVPAGDGK